MISRNSRRRYITFSFVTLLILFFGALQASTNLGILPAILVALALTGISIGLGLLDHSFGQARITHRR